MIFRRLYKPFGLDYVFTEMISAEGLIRDNRVTKNLLTYSDYERPIGAQIFGGNPDSMGQAARVISELGFDSIDINMGCPAKKVVRNNAGASLLRDSSLALEVVESVVANSDIKVSVKLRAGWERVKPEIYEFAKAAEKRGVSFLIMHPRTRTQRFSGKADWGIIKKLKEILDIPVIGNGDILTPQDAVDMLDYTHCDGIVLARGVLGNPWLIEGVKDYLAADTGDTYKPDLAQRVDFVLKHTRAMIEQYGEKWGIIKMRKHIAWYFKGIEGVKELRRNLGTLSSYTQLEDRLKGILEG